MTKLETGRRVALATSVALFGASLFLPAFTASPGDAGSPGVLVLMTGWLGLVAIDDSPSNLAWLANVALAASWGLSATRKRVPAAVITLAALMMAALPLLTGQVAIDEAGVPRPIIGFGLGYVTWCGAIAAALIAACLTNPDSADR